MTTPVERELPTWQDLAAYVVDRGLGHAVRFSQGTGRAYVQIGHEIVWAHVGQATLSPDVAGSSYLQAARLNAYCATLPAMSEDERRRMREAPDPPQWQIDAYLERQGRL